MPDVNVPETRYTRTSDGVHIAYQVLGDGPVDFVWIPGFVSHIEFAWTHPTLARLYRRIASFSRLILFDKRGTGMSDRVAPDYYPDLETRMIDVQAVMDATGSERAVILGLSEGGPMAMLFAATYPERTIALIAHRPVHRHRRLHLASSRDGRPAMAGGRRRAPQDRSRSDRALPRARGQDHGRWVSRDLRWAGARDQGGDRLRRGRAAAGDRNPRWPPHRECEMLDDDVGGIAVAIGARVGALAGPSEVLVSQTVKDLVAGSGLTFEDAGEYELKGVPDRWRLYRVID
jgi:pimeloyl-ACP methyl ester carboxylesterase